MNFEEGRDGSIGKRLQVFEAKICVALAFFESMVFFCKIDDLQKQLKRLNFVTYLAWKEFYNRQPLWFLWTTLTNIKKQAAEASRVLGELKPPTKDQ